MRALLLALWLVGCTGDISNELFVEDARFRAALPSSSALTVAWPVAVELPADPEPDPILLSATLDAMAGTNRWGDTLAAAVGPALGGTPTERGEHYRVWGPFPWDDNPGAFLRVEMSRTTDAALYTFAVGISNASSGPWAEFFTGTAASDPALLGGWNGELVWDLDALAAEIPLDAGGLIRLRHLDGAPRALELEVEGWHEGAERVDAARSLFSLEEDGAGRMELVGELALTGGEAAEHMRQVSQWTAAGQGRADALFSGGDLGDLRPAPSQCWAADGAVVWQGDPTGVFAAAGEEADCAEGLLPGDPDAL